MKLTDKSIFVVHYVWRIQSIHCMLKCHNVFQSWYHHKQRISIQDAETFDYHSQVTSNCRYSVPHLRRHCYSLTYFVVPTAMPKDGLLVNSIQLVMKSDDLYYAWNTNIFKSLKKLQKKIEYNVKRNDEKANDTEENRLHYMDHDFMRNAHDII